MSRSGSCDAYDVIIIGAGAAGLMCAAVAGRQSLRVLVLDHANKPGKKILMSGGGRCNFTNLHCGPDDFICANPHFVRSALSRYTQWDFIALVERHGIAYHEREHGQLFCDSSSRDILNMLLGECRQGRVELRTRTPVLAIQPGAPHQVRIPDAELDCRALVIATGGLSIPSMGASAFGHELARQWGLAVQPTRPALVPLFLEGRALAGIQDLSGIALDCEVSAGGRAFRENLLFTHRGLSGPAVLQASSYWRPGQPLSVDFFPEQDLEAHLRQSRERHPRRELRTLLAERLTRRVAQRWCELWLPDKALNQLSEADIQRILSHCKSWTVWPSGTGGYKLAEVTAGGVDTDALSSRTMECKSLPGVYFIGEVLDVTGHLGGFNFQWAWSSAHAAALAIAGA